MLAVNLYLKKVIRKNSSSLVFSCGEVMDVISKKNDVLVLSVRSIRQWKFFLFGKKNAAVRIDLVNQEGGYQIKLSSSRESVVVGGSREGKARIWRSADSALAFIGKHFGMVGPISVYYALEKKNEENVVG